MDNSLEEFKKKYSYEKATPMMRQYLDIKASHLDCLVLFRMGDFYELFFEDAIIAEKILGIVLAKRGKNDDEYIPMCGVPYHAIDAYLKKLIEADYKVAISEQLESPEEAKKRGYKAIVRREVVRIVTPGTIIEDSILNHKEPNYLCSLVFEPGQAAICYLDINTAEFGILEVKTDQIINHLYRLAPKELIVSEKIKEFPEIFVAIASLNFRTVYQPDSFFDARKNTKIIEDFYIITSFKALGNLSKLQICATGTVLEYLKITQKNNMPVLGFPKIVSEKGRMLIDLSAVKSLELLRNSQGNFSGSLLSVIDKTITKGGSRKLYNFICSPSTEPDVINKRLDLTEFFFRNLTLVDRIRSELKMVGDIERSLTKIAGKRALPNDLILIREALKSAIKIREIIVEAVGIKLPEGVMTIFRNLTADEEIIDLLDRAIMDDAPANLASGGYIKRNYHVKIAQLYDLLENTNRIIDDLKEQYKLETAIDSLKITNNNILGYYIEISPRHASKIVDEKFIHKQTLSTAIRYTTTELQKLETDILAANNTVIALEQSIFYEICAKLLAKSDNIKTLTRSITQLDVFCNFAYIADEYNYVKPFVDDSNDFIVENGRHPVIEVSLKKLAKSFIPNNCKLIANNGNINLITGPNMGGKSTFLRQNAVIAVLAQIGSFVPCSLAKIGCIDKLFSRVGASDDLAGGQSTFMVEMIETSSILNQATEKSMVILDEVGRGTSTYDGVSIAWSCLEYIHNKLKCRALFATHYHELTVLKDTLKNIHNYTVAISESGGVIKLLHKIIPGAADKSYGIHVAELAGLPRSVILRAKQILRKFEESSYEKHTNASMLEKSPGLFDYANNLNDVVLDRQKLLEKIKSLDPENMSPLQAIEAIFNLKKEFAE